MIDNSVIFDLPTAFGFPQFFFFFALFYVKTTVFFLLVVIIFSIIYEWIKELRNCLTMDHRENKGNKVSTTSKRKISFYLTLYRRKKKIYCSLLSWLKLFKNQKKKEEKKQEKIFIFYIKIFKKIVLFLFLFLNFLFNRSKKIFFYSFSFLAFSCRLLYCLQLPTHLSCRY